MYTVKHNNNFISLFNTHYMFRPFWSSSGVPQRDELYKKQGMCGTENMMLAVTSFGNVHLVLNK